MAGVQPDLGVEPAVSVGWVPEMVLLKQQDIGHKASGSVGWVGKAFLPGIKAAAPDAHCFAEQLNRERPGKLQDYLIFLLPYRITVPSPFTSYPFLAGLP